MGRVRDITSEVFDAVLFDNDGTLIDSRDAVVRSWLAWAADNGVAAEALIGFHGVPSSSIIADVAPHLDPVSATADIDGRELADLEGIVALPGATEAIAAVGWRGAIVTSATRELVTVRLAAAGFTAPEVLVSANDISRGKPDPEPYLIAAEKLAVDPTRCLVVEDAPAGLRSGRAAGAATVAVVTTSSVEELEPLADLVVDDLSALTFTLEDEGVRVSRR
ncbi:HAD-IA family hydrolase [Ornithinimicrobium cryptoxanthini]|uniref:HAD-IA family hydrolase n=1 Tax=Ornithinimicrobium cryptoxanthini TaxID=2934161 RepID=A0ABY4YM03_9MICO|nr:HAD-IA family hydrolase [Ornithinimicrobium cryptoxanthini]USQ77754.1 HAD-IA family hydrolase [Ornithinimicrobium cryptoxanthini]